MFPAPLSPKGVVMAAALLCAAGTALAQTKQSNPTPSKGGTTSVAKTGAEIVLYVPGAYQDWKPATAPQIGAVAGSTRRFEGYVNFTGTGEQPFKFTDAPDWTHTNYGNKGGNKLDPDGQAGGLTVPAGGYYELTADLDKLTWTATKVTWSIVGNATPGGWEKDTPMTYDPDKQVWTVTVALKADGSYKFRANNAWKIDFGLDSNGKLQYVDNPFFDYAPQVKDLTVPDDGTYVLTLDLHVPGNYKYSIVPAK